jgi:hypothetical protein
MTDNDKYISAHNMPLSPMLHTTRIPAESQDPPHGGLAAKR